jgi:nucleoside-triphosphatase
MDVYSSVLLLTGPPGSGKTTTIQKVVELLGDEAGGFYTQEIREAGQRVGFQLVTLDGQWGWLARKVSTPPSPREMRFGNYLVDLDTIESLAITAVQHAIAKGQVVVIDEIGPMELLSPAFREVVHQLLRTPNLQAVGTIVQRPHQFADWVKAHPSVTILQLTPENRDDLPRDIYASLMGGRPAPRLDS